MVKPQLPLLCFTSIEKQKVHLDFGNSEAPVAPAFQVLTSKMFLTMYVITLGKLEQDRCSRCTFVHGLSSKELSALLGRCKDKSVDRPGSNTFLGVKLSF